MWRVLSEPMQHTVQRLINGDARDLSFIESESVHLVVTSPQKTGKGKGSTSYSYIGAKSYRNELYHSASAINFNQILKIK